MSNLTIKKGLRIVVVLVILTMVIFPKPAHAYLTPATGSYVIQILAAVFFGGAFLVKVYWGKIKSLISGKDKKHSEKPSEKNK